MGNLNIRVGLDPFVEDLKNWQPVKQAVETLGADRVTPTFLLGFNYTHWVCNSEPSDNRGVRDIALEKMKKFVSDLGLAENSNWVDPEVLMVKSFSQREDIAHLAKVLSEEKCDLFVANTHARSGIERLFLGSFAENLLLKVKVPMLFLSPRSKTVKPFKTVLFATDFSDESLATFEKFLHNDLLAEKPMIHLYSKLPGEPPPLAVEGTLDYYNISTVNFEEIKKKTEAWKERAEQAGYKIDFTLDESSTDLATAVVEKSAELDSDLLVLGSNVGPTEVIFTGSNTREIIRQSQLPVLVWHFDN